MCGCPAEPPPLAAEPPFDQGSFHLGGHQSLGELAQQDTVNRWLAGGGGLGCARCQSGAHYLSAWWLWKAEMLWGWCTISTRNDIHTPGWKTAEGKMCLEADWTARKGWTHPQCNLSEAEPSVGHCRRALLLHAGVRWSRTQRHSANMRPNDVESERKGENSSPVRSVLIAVSSGGHPSTIAGSTDTSVFSTLQGVRHKNLDHWMKVSTEKKRSFN